MASPHLVAVLASLLLAAPPVLLDPTPSPSVPSAVPCPRAKPTGAIPPIKPSPLPKHDPSAPVMGGAALGSASLVVPPDSPPLPRNITAKSWIVADLDTGAVLGACGAHEYGAPASVQKLLLTATLLPKLDLKQVVSVTFQDLQVEPGSSLVGLVPNGKYSIETLWLGLLLNSGNDAANVLARVGGGAGGVNATLAAMNEYARQLGALDTHAATPSGLDGPGQVTSAYDLALIARACFKLDNFRRYEKTLTAQIPPQPPKYRGFQIQNDNPLISEYPGAIGGKTGLTDIARHTFVGAAERNGTRLVVALLGAENRPARGWQQGAALLDWGFEVDPSQPVGELVLPESERPLPTPATTGPSVASADKGSPFHFTAVSAIWLASAGALLVLALAVTLIAVAARRSRFD